MEHNSDIQEAIDQLQLDIARARGEARAASTFGVMVANYFLQTIEDPQKILDDLERVLKSASIPKASLDATLDAADIAYMELIQSSLAELRRQTSLK